MRSSVARRPGLIAALIVAAALVLLRSYIFLRYAPAFFDSDQAVIGLMAKHLSEGRGFPLFFYGQNYMLGVESWIAVPFFWAGGPTVAMLRLPLVLVNVAVVVTTILLLTRRGLGAGAALVATLPLAITTPVLSTELVTALGASIEPFLYLYVLWALRRKPLVFGAVYCLTALHREFTLFALPALVVAQRIEGEGWTLRQWIGAGVACAAVWIGIDVIKWHVSTLGPGAGSVDTSSLVNEARMVGAWLSFDPAGYFARLAGLVRTTPALIGGQPYALRDWSLDDTLVAGSTVAGVAIAAGLSTALIRLVRTLKSRVAPEDRQARRRQLALPVYLALVAGETIAAYGLNGDLNPALLPVTRYVLFALLAPVALLSAWLMVETRRTWRVTGILLVAGWASFTAGDSVRWLAKLRRAPPGSEFQALANDLVAHGVRFGRAQYWDAYVVTFFARERVIIASTDKIRILSYQTAVDAHPSETAMLTRVPCESGRRVASWCVVGPADRSP